MNMNTEDPIINKIKQNTRQLEKINNDIRLLLNKMPLKHYAEIARMHRLISEQQRLMSLRTGGIVPARFMLPFDNARHTAVFLRSKYSAALTQGKLREKQNKA